MSHRIDIYPNGGKIKLKNRRIVFCEGEDKSLQIEFRNVGLGDPNVPSCHHEVLKGKIRVTGIKISEESMDALVTSYQAFKQYQLKLDLENIKGKRCCGRCIEGLDECVNDTVCADHNEKGCEICYGER